MQIAGIRSVLNGRTIRPDAPTGRTAEPAQPARDAAATVRSGALVPLPTLRGAAPARPVLIAFPTAEDAAIPPARTSRDAQRAYRDTQNLAAPRALLAAVEDIAEAAAPSRSVARAARADAPTRDEAAVDGPRPTPTGVPGLAAQGLATLWRLLPGQAGIAVDGRRTSPGKATATGSGRTREMPAEQGGWTEALTLFTLIATVCLAVWLLLF
jgi:hypothetical protein